ncbi:MAG: FtsW/RodA/SpoVE family cell cycle protein, partial [Spirochaetaceae bacterium]|nr:FtsW/RodA/SpoVE family cell cycle protein [Spirochaetaceae bacterium]
MRRFNVEKTGDNFRADHILVISVLLLTGLGLVTLYSASYAFAERFFDDGFYFITRQFFLGGIGIVLFILASRINLEIFRKWIKPLILGTIALCVLTFVPGIGVIKNGAARWVRIGWYTYQPSEFVKLILPLY